MILLSGVGDGTQEWKIQLHGCKSGRVCGRYICILFHTKWYIAVFLLSIQDTPKLALNIIKSVKFISLNQVKLIFGLADNDGSEHCSHWQCTVVLCSHDSLRTMGQAQGGAIANVCPLAQYKIFFGPSALLWWRRSEEKRLPLLFLTSLSRSKQKTN